MSPIKKYGNQLVVRQLRQRVVQLLSKYDLTIIMVTGTIGKTSTKLAIGQLLEKAGRKVCYSEDSYNTEVGIPLAIFNMKAPERVASPVAWVKVLREMDERLQHYPYDTIVIEISEDECDLMLPWVKLIKPQISVLTGVSPAHMVRFESVDQLLDDSITLASQAKELYYHADFAAVQARLGRTKGAHGYGLDKGVVRFEKLSRRRDGLITADLVMGKAREQVKTQMVATQSLGSLLAAASVALALGVERGVIVRSLGLIGSVKGRMRLLPAVNGARLIDDTYNSSPLAVVAALDTLKEMKAGRYMAVLGSMNELGDHSADLHRQVGLSAAEHKLDLLVTVGKEAASYIIPAAIEAGMDKAKIKQFRTPYEAGHYLKKLLKDTDLVLVKGSQNAVFTEETSRILLGDGLDPEVELVRQSKGWKARKKRSFGL